MRINIAVLIVLTISIELIYAGKRKKSRDEARRTESKTKEMDSMICPSCDRLYCTVKKESRLKCKGGTTTDICGCCPVCAKQEDEPCGGEWNYLGKCDRGLYCRAATISLLQTNNFYPHPQIRTEVPMGGMPEGTCVKQPNIIQDPPDSSSSQIQTRDNSPAKCQPRCTPDFCLKNPREICSAVDVVDLKRECHGSCQHTSCQACSWVDPDPDCGACDSDDFRCIKRFAKCIKRNFCSRQKFPCKQIGDNEHIGKFQCMVPKCLDKS